MLVALFLIMSFLLGASSFSDQVYVCRLPNKPVKYLLALGYPACRLGLWFAGDGSATGGVK
jgi:hypothetical protein